MWLSVCRPLGDGESVLGYLWGVSHLSGYLRLKDLVTELNGRQAIQPPWTVPSGLARICEAFNPVFGSPEDIIKNNTCLPAHFPFIDAAARAAVVAHALKDEWEPGVASMIGITGRAIQSKPVMALCLDCVKDDDRQFGFAYWHREHCLAGIGYCPRHGTPLVAGCGSCRYSHRLARSVRVPQLKCWCQGRHTLSHPRLAPADAEVVKRAAKYGQQLLDGALEGATPEVLGAYYFMRAREMGYVAGTRLQSGRLMDDVRKRYSPAVLARLNATMPGQQNWLGAMLGRRAASNVLGKNLLLFDFFGGCVPSKADLHAATQLLAEIKQQDEDEAKSHPGTPRSDSQSEAQRETDRQTIEAFVRASPEATRTDTLKALGRTLVRARKHDADWLDVVLPTKRPRDGTKTEEQSATYWRSMDTAMSCHVYAKRDALLAKKNDFGKKLTKRVLLAGYRRGNEVTEEWLEKLPLTKQALYECIETSLEHKRALARAVIEENLQRTDLLAFVKEVTGLPSWVIRDIFAKVQWERRLEET